ncbi:SDR family NAD(P)-dependent oxidoreductase [Spirosoma montaniterrae]|uniref:Short-chain dehydrogenase n=1 Tax=Spirosoma montaniterrae TaxID=1178516 RepID=A0A1P9X0Q7_9BACT|nr:SDR family oxidoreductase [Spirosoma montaniterrae]AQG81217.1 short-chain dehydrogenase [Spirosoma montaniterrae]
MNNSKIALVTGGSRGLGRDMALSLARKGMDVIVTYRSQQQEAEEVVNAIQEIGQKAVALPLDMNNLASYDTFVEAVSEQLSSQWNVTGFDFLVNNAGMGGTVPFVDVTEAFFDEFLNVHYKGIFFLTQKLLPYMNEGGGIVNISTGTTRFVNPGYSVYASMKGAMEVLTRYWAKELGAKGIRCNIVAPGPVETDFNNAAIRSNPQLKERLASLSPLNRVGNADDIGGVVAFLCTDEARWINAQRIEVSGGINA